MFQEKQPSINRYTYRDTKNVTLISVLREISTRTCSTYIRKKLDEVHTQFTEYILIIMDVCENVQLPDNYHVSDAL